MLRKFFSYTIADHTICKQQMLNWASQFNIFCFLDNHQYASPYNSFECLLAVGAIQLFNPVKHSHEALNSFVANTDDWIFGHFNYELNNPIKEALSVKPDMIGFPELVLFVPEILIKLHGNEIHIGISKGDGKSILTEIESTEIDPRHVPIVMEPRISMPEYLTTVQQILKHIKRGDCYELNFCQEYYSEKAVIHPATAYWRLQHFSPTPFSAFYRVENSYLMCASPERFLKRTGNKILSQPIKGTAARGENEELDWQYRTALLQSKKERSENVMVVDLVRNDLSKICQDGSVRVDELFGIYSFPNVHQMISTISGTLANEISFAEILQATFPMGSMTGAPKHKVMELIEKYEITRRGIFSGAVGYIAPNKDFDFNVVIRSLMYNSDHKYLSYQVGGGITANSNPQKEYEECLVKARAINKVLGK